MKRHALLCAAVLLIVMPRANAQKPFTLEQVMSAPFPANLTAAKQNNRVAWTLNQEGRRNIWVAEGPGFAARQITKYNQDDGQELSDLSFSADSNTIIYVRGDGKNTAGQVPNPLSNPTGTEQAVWTVAWSGSEPKRVDAGHSPDISSRGMIAYAKDGQIWIAPLDGAEKPQQLVVRGQNLDSLWSPDGSRLAFVSKRNDHVFVAVYDVAAKTVQFMAPSVDSDGDPAWSLDGRRIAFVRRPAEARDAPQGYFIAPDKPHPWAVWVADAAAGTAKEIWHSSATPQGSRTIRSSSPPKKTAGSTCMRCPPREAPQSFLRQEIVKWNNGHLLRTRRRFCSIPIVGMWTGVTYGRQVSMENLSGNKPSAKPLTVLNGVRWSSRMD
jgi:dipeptidyl aminopeptidase/acylaminoacyl peptidase